MRFSVDAHAIGQHLTGNETYVRNLLHCFAEMDDDAEFIAYLSRGTASGSVPAGIGRRFVSGNPYVRLGADLTRRLRIDSPDLLHVQYTAPLGCPVPVVVSVHDVSFLEYPQFFTRFRAAQLRLTVRRTVKAAACVLTPSEFSRRSIIRAYKLDEDKVRVTPNGVSSAFRPVSRENSMRWVRANTGVPTPYILTVGDLQPRKNHLKLIQAFEQLLQAYPHLPHHLVMVGKPTWYSSVIRTAAAKSGLAERIHFTGFVDDEELLRLYGGCDLFVYPSLYEGFGIPILEAMACGRAVACSDTSAMPEVADSAALLFNPNSVSEMVLAMRDYLLDPELRIRMERLGQKRASLFSWETTARKTLEAYYEVAGSRRPVFSPARTPVSLARP